MIFSDFALNRTVLELRYEEAFIYWDTCGSINSAIKAGFPNWKWEKTTTELSAFREVQKKMELNFNISSIKFVQDQVESLNQFKLAAKEITPQIIEKLKLTKFTRVGNRFIYVLGLESIDQGTEIIKKSKLIQVPEDKLGIFGDSPYKSTYIIYIKNGDNQYRVELAAIERVDEVGAERIDEKFFPKYGLRVDVDFSINKKMQIDEISLEDYIQANFKFLENNLVQLVR
ncbi:MAG: hypothetical protein ABFD52_10130 [Acidobacteriota bacterium]